MFAKLRQIIFILTHHETIVIGVDNEQLEFMAYTEDLNHRDNMMKMAYQAMQLKNKEDGKQ